VKNNRRIQSAGVREYNLAFIRHQCASNCCLACFMKSDDDDFVPDSRRSVQQNRSPTP
jgi:hypothetical protein